MKGFGLAYLRGEGCAIHPDDFLAGEMPDELYEKFLKAYIRDYGIEITEQSYCSRLDILNKIKNEDKKI